MYSTYYIEMTHPKNYEYVKKWRDNNRENSCNSSEWINLRDIIINKRLRDF